MPSIVELATKSLLPALLSLSFAATAGARQTEDDGLGRIDFPNSGAPEAQADFLRGALLLHSFEYEDAAEAFRAAQEADPGFALAYWGEALTHSHPIWQEDDPEAARAALARLAPTAEERLAKAPTERERGLLRAVEVLFGEGERPARNARYSDALAALAERHPDDLEIQSLYALSLLGTSRGGRDTRVYMRAAAVAEEVYRRAPEHPGALHYLIHSYDDPVHAPLGLRMAHAYARVAPAAQHALHMPSHIFVALGMWDESVRSNVDSAAAADARRVRKGLGVDARGYHSLQWLAYSYLQLGRVVEARALLDDMVRDAAESGSVRARSTLASMRATHLVATDDWRGEVARIAVDADGASPAIFAADRFVAGRIALAAGDAEAAAAAVRAIAERRRTELAPPAAGAEAAADADCCEPAYAGSLAPEERPDLLAALVMETQLDGLALQAAGRADAGLERLRQAAATEDRIPFDFGPPDIVAPAHELLGQALLDANLPTEAAREFQAALDRAPGRARALLGLARARTAANETAAARATYAELLDNWHAADQDLPALREARRHATAAAPPSGAAAGTR